MSKETLVRVEFLIDIGRKEMPYVASTCFLKSTAETTIPGVNPEHAEHVGDKVDSIRITVFQEVD